MGIYSVEALSISKIGDLLVEQLGEDAAEYTFPEDFEKAVVDIGFKGIVFNGDSAPYDMVVIGEGLNGVTGTTSKDFDCKSVHFVGTKTVPSILFRGAPITSIIGEETLETINAGAFYGCPIVGNLNFENLVTFGSTAFCDCSLLVSVKLPKVTSCGDSCLLGCTGLQSVEIGSVGYPVTVYDYRFFTGCTQANLTVTIYLSSRIDTILADIRRCATNATIIVKAANDIVYNNVSYQAGDTVVTSTPS